MEPVYWQITTGIVLAAVALGTFLRGFVLSGRAEQDKKVAAMEQRIDDLEARLEVDGRVRSEARVKQGERLATIEQRLQQVPTVEAMQRLLVEVAEMRGEVRQTNGLLVRLLQERSAGGQ